MRTDSRIGVALAAALTLTLTITAAGRQNTVVSGDAARRVDGYLSRLVPYGFSGAVLIAKDGAIVLEKGYGLADRAAGRPYTPDLVSCIGSVTKQFTGAAIVKLETEGKLLTSDPIAKYLPGVPADKAAITIHHLLTHTAGFSGDLGGSDEEPIARDALVAKVLAAPLASAPGARFEYSNEGYALAGAIIERVSGQGYEPYLREHLFLPAGMHDTGYLIPEWPLDRLPKGYGDDQTEWGRVYKRGWLPDGPGWYLRANGGIHSSLDDLYKWHLALESGKVLSKGATKKYLTGYVASLGGGERYAYGWGVRKTARGTTVISHNGGNGFFFTDFRRYADEKVVIIAMSNQPVISATELAPGQIESLFFGGAPVITPPVAVSVPRARRDAIAGTYALANGATITLRATEAGLEAESSDPFIFRASTIRRASATLTDLEARTLSLVEEAAKGNYRPLFEAFDDERPFEVVQGNQTKYWAGWRAQYGEFQKAEVLGTGRAQGDPAVQVRLRFARGGPILQFVWGPRRLAGWRAMPGAEAVPLAAQSPDTWIYYSYREPHLVQLSFTTDGSLVIARGDSTITGRKS